MGARKYSSHHSVIPGRGSSRRLGQGDPVSVIDDLLALDRFPGSENLQVRMDLLFLAALKELAHREYDSARDILGKIVAGCPDYHPPDRGFGRHSYQRPDDPLGSEKAEFIRTHPEFSFSRAVRILHEVRDTERVGSGYSVV